MLIDSHAHITSDVFDNCFEDIFQAAQEQEIGAIINICTHPLELEKGLKLRERFPWLYNAASTTPHGAGERGEMDFEYFSSTAKQGNLVAIGETGLDYHYYADTKDQQKKFLRAYLNLALECRLPVIIHCREAYADLFEILDEFPYIKGVLHCFTGTYDEALEVIKRGLYLSLSGIVTFKKSLELQEVAKIVPLERLLIETDAPYLAPQSKRGKINQPAYLKEIAEFIAKMRQISFESIATATFQNACQLFNLKK